MSSDFFRTRMGQTFYEATMPSLVRELARLTGEKITDAVRSAVLDKLDRERRRDDVNTATIHLPAIASVQSICKRCIAPILLAMPSHLSKSAFSS